MSGHRALRAVYDGFAGEPGPAWRHVGGDLSYAALHRRAGALAARLAGERSPVLIWGHKDAAFAVAYWACLLAGRPLIPVEPDLPPARVRAIARACGAGAILRADARRAPPPIEGLAVLDAAAAHPEALPPATTPAGGEAAYVLFSSGTSGAPKGIRISYDNLAHFVAWLADDLLAAVPFAAVSGNVRHCFDVSLFELWGAWLRRAAVSALDHAEFASSRKYVDRYARHRVGLWVSTPSAAAPYLRDPAFSARALPELRTFLFCGEVLPKALVATLWERFPGAAVWNTYGPTECTVAVTAIRIEPRHLAAPEPLPIGRPRPGARLSLEAGEIVIAGPCVGPGYVGLPERQAAAFLRPGVYRTGDRGSLGADSAWRFQGRGDREVKIQGVRIDLAEIERLIAEQPGIRGAVVDPHLVRDVPRALDAYVGGASEPDDLAALAGRMAAELPRWMVPRFWFGCREAPLGPGGKLARAALVDAARGGGLRHVHH